MENVRIFANDVNMRKEVKEYIIEVLKKEIITKAFNGQDVKDLAEARNIIDISFDAMVKEFTREQVKQVFNEME